MTPAQETKLEQKRRLLKATPFRVFLSKGEKGLVPTIAEARVVIHRWDECGFTGDADCLDP